MVDKGKSVSLVKKGYVTAPCVILPGTYRNLKGSAYLFQEHTGNFQEHTGIWSLLHDSCEANYLQAPQICETPVELIERLDLQNS